MLVDDLRGRAIGFLKRYPRFYRRLHGFPPVRANLVHPHLHVWQIWGGTLNVMRHCGLARSMGADAALVTPSGKNTYGRFNVVDVPYVGWSDIRADDLVVVPDFASELVNRLEGPVIVYLQNPQLVYNNYDYMSSRVTLWTDSPFMVDVCRSILPGREVPIVPNIVDPVTFPYRPQSEREPVVFAFPRKGPEYIEATQEEYTRLGGKHFRFELIHGLSLFELAKAMQRPQVFLASAEIEGCALPPQESMACGMVVVGKSARGANFAMEHRRTAMVAETPQEAAQCLRELEDLALRDSIARRARELISRYFPENEPTALWRSTLARCGIAYAPNLVGYHRQYERTARQYS